MPNSNVDVSAPGIFKRGFGTLVANAVAKASNGDALGPWLRDNGFVVPLNVDPIVNAYDADDLGVLRRLRSLSEIHDAHAG